MTLNYTMVFSYDTKYRSQKKKINQTLSKFLLYCKEHHQESESNPQNTNTFANHISDKGIIFKIYK